MLKYNGTKVVTYSNKLLHVLNLFNYYV